MKGATEVDIFGLISPGFIQFDDNCFDLKKYKMALDSTTQLINEY